MKRDDFRNPLIQSGAVLLGVFLLISIVAGSESQGIFSSLGALISGLFSGIVFLIGLSVAILVSIVVIIALFFAAISMHSVDKARTLFDQLKNVLKSFYAKITGTTLKPTETREAETVVASPAQPVKHKSHDHLVSQDLAEVRKSIKTLEDKLDALETANTSMAEQLTQCRTALDALQNPSAEDQADQDDLFRQATDDKIAALASQIEASSKKVIELETALNQTQESVRKDITDLQEKTTVPEVISGILSYIDKPEDRETITKKAEEAVARGMTYAQIDDFFKKSLPQKVYKVLAEHPRLTKDFLRSVKKKFA